ARQCSLRNQQPSHRRGDFQGLCQGAAPSGCARCGKSRRAEHQGHSIGLTMPRSLQELLDTDDPAGPIVQQWIPGATNQVKILPPCEPARSRALEQAQVTLRSPMGAIVYETGGLLIDHGWLRILGSGHPRLPRTLMEWNRTCRTDGFLLIADDVAGGFFAING